MEDLIIKIGEILSSKKWRMATAESCTGGLISGALTEVSGSSDWFSGAVTAYANDIKSRVLGVENVALETHGAVSGPVVEAMAIGVNKLMCTEVSVAVSGIAGPTGGTPGKPVGTVWIAWALPDKFHAEKFQFGGDRKEVREKTVLMALTRLLELLEK